MSQDIRDSSMGPKLKMDSEPMLGFLKKKGSSVDMEKECVIRPEKIITSIFQQARNKKKKKRSKAQYNSPKRVQDYLSKPRKLGITNYILIFIKLIHFVRKLKRTLGYHKITTLRENQFHMINDLGHVVDKDEMDYLREEEIIYTANKVSLVSHTFLHEFGGKISRLRKSLRRLRQIIPVFAPSDRSKLLWDLILIIVFYYYALMISLQMSFGFFLENASYSFSSFPPRKEVESITFFCIFANIFIKLNTSIYLSGELVSKRSKILANFLKGEMILDLLAILPFVLGSVSGEAEAEYGDEKLQVKNPWKRFSQLLFLLKYFEISRSIKNLKEGIFLGEKAEAIFSLFGLIIKMMVYAHIYACLWHVIGQVTNDNGSENWLLKNKLLSSDWFTRYSLSVYFALTTMVTVGYGDITPVNQYERIFVIFGLLVGSGIFGYSINRIGIILETIQKSEKRLRNKLRILNRFMKKKSLDYSLQVRVRKHIILQESEGFAEITKEEEKVLETLPPTLKDEVYIQSKGKFLTSYYPFAQYFSEETLRKLVHIMRPVGFSPEETVYSTADANVPCIYFLTKGEVLLLLESEQKRSLIKKIRGDIFGDLEFFMDSKRICTAKAALFSSGFFMRRDEFLEIVRASPLDYEAYCMIKDNILLYDNWKDLKSGCFSCSDISHVFYKCPKVRALPMKDIILQKYTYSPEQTREKFYRSRESKTRSALILKKLINFRCKDFIEAIEREFLEDEELNNYDEGDGSFSYEQRKPSKEEILDTPSPLLAKPPPKNPKEPAVKTETRRKSALFLFEHKPIMEEDSQRDKKFLNLETTVSQGASKRDLFNKINTLDLTSTGKINPSFVALEKAMPSLSVIDSPGVKPKLSKQLSRFGTLRSLVNEPENQESLPGNHKPGEPAVASRAGIIKGQNLDRSGMLASQGDAFTSKDIHSSFNALIDEKDVIHMYFPHFDRMKNFTTYFPNNNAESVVSKIRKNRNTKTVIKPRTSKKDIVLRNLLDHYKKKSVPEIRVNIIRTKTGKSIFGLS